MVQTSSLCSANHSLSSSITALVQQRQKDLDYRAEMMDRLNNSDKEKAAMAQSIERLTNQKRNLEAERDSLLAKAKLFDKTLREERFKDIFHINRSNLSHIERSLTQKKTSWPKRLSSCRAEKRSINMS